MSRGPSESTTAPLYCARCRRVGEGEERLCYACGEALRPQGFCTVCEGWAFAGPGEPCPKHDLELLDRPDESENEGTSAKLVTIASYAMPSQAQGPRLRLEAEGIPVFLLGERMGDNVLYSVATGGVKLQVPEQFVPDARVLLSQTWRWPRRSRGTPTRTTPGRAFAPGPGRAAGGRS